MEVWGGNQGIDRDLKTTGLDVCVYSQPYATAQSGGDVYYVSSCASGRITRLLLADVSGHGDPVSDRAEFLRKLMRKNINIIDQSTLVTAINGEFAADCNTGMFATALIGTFFQPTRTLSISNAGHPTPLIYRAQSKTWQELTETSANRPENRHFPLGIALDQNYSEFRTKLSQGDLVLWFTDGLTEMQCQDGSQLGQTRLLQVLADIDVPHSRSVIHDLIDRISPKQSEVNKSDDVSLISFQLNGEKSSLVDNSLAPFRVLSDWFSRDPK